MGEIDLQACEGRFLLALGFGSLPEEAGHLARASLLEGAERSREEYLRSWRDWQESLPALPQEGRLGIVRPHESGRPPRS